MPGFMNATVGILNKKSINKRILYNKNSLYDRVVPHL